jgi:hypothetical protein
MKEQFNLSYIVDTVGTQSGDSHGRTFAFIQSCHYQDDKFKVNDMDVWYVWGRW